MSITLDLPQELESKLATEATQMGLSLAEYVLRFLSTDPRRVSAPPGQHRLPIGTGGVTWDAA